MEEPTFLVTMASQMDGTKTEQIGITALNGIAAIGWKLVNGAWYYLDPASMVRCPLGI